MHTTSKVGRLAAAFRSAIASVALLALGATTAYAGMSGSITPTYTSPMNVGDTAVGVTLTITNFSNGANANNDVGVTGIFHTPSCGTVLGGCAAVDNGVFLLSNPRPDPTTACAGRTFIIQPGVNPGEVEFKPDSDVVLHKSIFATPPGTLAQSQCTILFDVQVLKAPVVDSSGDPGVQTSQLARLLQLQDLTTGDRGFASGSGKVTITSPLLTIAKTPDAGAPPINAGQTATFTIVVTNSGTGTATNVSITDTLPNNGGVVWALASGAGCSVSAGNPQILTCNAASLAVGSSITAVVTASTSPAVCAVWNNTASAGASNFVDTTAVPIIVSDPGQITCLAPALAIAKTPDAGGPPVNAGATATFTIVVTNTGAGTASGVTITDTLPNNGGVTWATATPNCGVSATNPQILTCNVGTLTSGAAFTAVVTAATSQSVCAVWNNTASASASNSGTVTDPGQITCQAPNLAIAKTPDVGGPPIVAGQTATFTIVVTNTGAGTANNVTMTDTLPNDGGVVWGTATPNCTISATNPQILSCNVGTLAPGASFSAVVTAATSQAVCTVWNNTASASGSNAGPVSDPGQITCQPPALNIAKTPDVGGPPINAGQTATFTIVVTNSGAGTANNVTLTDTLPNNGGVVWGTATPNCSISATNPQILTCNVGTLASGAAFSAVVTAATNVDVCAVWNNTASASASNAGTVSDPGQITCLSPALAIAKTPDVGAPPINAGATATFTIVVTNTGAGTANSVTITDTLPNNGGVVWATVTPNCSVSATNPQILTCNVGTLASGASFTAVVTAATSQAVCAVWNNTASASSSNAGTVTDPGQITCQSPTLTIAKTPDVGGPPIVAGATATFTIVVTNTGAGIANNVTITDTLPNNGGVSWATVTPNCSISATNPQILTCNVGTLASGASFTAVVTASTSQAVCAVWNNTASASGSNAGVVTDPGQITCLAPNLAIAKTPDVGGPPINAGQTATFTIVVTNTGAGTANGVTITDTLPNNGGVSWATVTPNCSVSATNPQILTCNVGTLASGASFTAVVTASTSQAVCAVWNNTASAVGSNAGVVTDPGQITCQAPLLTVAKSPDAPNNVITSGATATFTIVVTNTGAGIANNVTITDTLPNNGGVVWATVTPNCSVSATSPQILTCNVGTLASGASFSAVVTAATSPAVCATWDNTASASASNAAGVNDPGQIVCQIPVLAIAKTPDAPNNVITSGATATFTIVVTNNGPGTATGVTISDTLPNNGGVVWATATPNCSVSATNPQILTCNVGSLNANASFIAVVTAATSTSVCATWDNNANVTSTNAVTKNDAGQIVCQVPVLAIAKTPDAPNNVITAGSTATFTIVVTNNGPGTATGVTISDTLPNSGGVVWALSSGAGCSVSATNPQILTCNVGSLNANASFTAVVTAATSASVCTTWDNTANVTSSNATAKNDAGQIVCQVPVLAIAKTPDAPNNVITSGSTATFTIVVTNNGPGTATGVTISDTLPNNGGVTWATATPNCSVSATSPQVLTCNVGSLNANASFSAVVTAATSASVCATWNNAASATSSNAASVNDPGQIVCQVPVLTIAKTPDAPNNVITAGATATFTIVVTNSGPGTATGVTISDTLPNSGGVVWALSSGAGCSVSATNPQILSCNVGSLAESASFTAVVTAATSASVCTTWDNTANVTSSNATAKNDTGQIVCQVPVLAIAKTPDSPNNVITAGATATFTIVVTNNGPGTATGVTISDTLPNNGGVTWATVSPSCSISATNPQILTCNVGSLNANASFTAVVTAATSTSVCATWDNNANVTSTNAVTKNDTGQIVCQVPVLAIAKTPDAPNNVITSGATATFTIVVTNNGPGTATGVTISDTLPNNGGVVWALSSGAGCSVSATNPQILTCNVGSLNANASFTAVVTAATSTSVCATWDNQANVTSTNAVTKNDTGQIVCQVPVLVIAKTPDAPSNVITSGATATFTIVVTNNGPGTATGVTISDTLPNNGGVTWATVSPNCSISATNPQILTCNVGSLNANASFTAVVTAATSASVCTTWDNTANVTSTNAVTKNDTGQIVCQVPVLAIAKTPDAPNNVITAGATATFTIVVTNNGPGTATGVTITDTLPNNGGVSWATATPNCSVSATNPQILTCNVGSLNANASFSAVVTATTSASVCATWNNTASASSSNTAPQTDTGQIVCQVPVLVVAKSPDSPNNVITSGATATFTIVVTNNGPGAATGVTITDTLPNNGGVSWATATPNCSISATNPQVLTCNVGSLNANASFSAVVTAATSASVCATWNNTASATSSNAASVNDTGQIVCQVPVLVVAKTPDSPNNNIIGGATATFTIVVTNNGPGTATGVTIVDTLPSNGGVSWGTTSPNCGIAGSNPQVLTCNVGSLTANSSFTAVVTATTSPVICSTWNNTATVNSSNAASTSDTGQIVCTAPCDLTLDKTCSVAGGAAYSCSSNTITSLMLSWGGPGTVYVRTPTAASPTPAVMGPFTPGTVVTNNVLYTATDKTNGTAVWNIYSDAAGTVQIGQSKFSLNCSDPGMSGVDDCFLPQGDNNGASCTVNGSPATCQNTWILEKITGSSATLDCNAQADNAGQPEAGCEVPALGGNVNYQYTVHNNTTAPVLITVTDDKNGTVVGPAAVTLPPNNSQVFTKGPVNITTVTVNTGTVHGNTQGGVDQCTATDKAIVVPLCFLGNPATQQLYPYGSLPAKTATVFNESTVLKGSEPTVATVGGTLRLWYSDEHALALGIRQVTGGPNPGSFPVTPFPLNNTAMIALGAPSGTLALSAGLDHTGVAVKPYFSVANNPASAPAGTPLALTTGALGCPGGCDPAGRPIAPSLFCTDITNANTNNGDWQIAGGSGHPPDFVSGTWKSATTVVSGSAPNYTVVTTVDSDGSVNVTKTSNPVTWIAGPDAEPPLGGYGVLPSLEKYGSEIRWNVNLLECGGQPLQSGHVYRMQFLIHDGDQNNSGGDSGQSCAIVLLP